MPKYKYLGLADEERARLKALYVKEMARPDRLLHSTVGSVEFRTANNARKDQEWERLKKMRLKEIEETLDSRDASICVLGIVFPKGEPVEVDFQSFPSGKPRERAKSKLASLVDHKVLEQVKEAPPEPEKRGPGRPPNTKK